MLHHEHSRVFFLYHKVCQVRRCKVRRCKVDTACIPPYTHPLMETIRTFIALEIPDDIQQDLKSFIERSQRIIPKGIRWVPSKNIHLTLKFLGETSKSQFSILQNKLAILFAQYLPIEVQFTNLGVFPNSRNPRVLWYGIMTNQALIQMVSEIEKMTKESHFPHEDRPFSPHLTIARVDPRQPADFLQNIQKWLIVAPALGIMNYTCNWVTLFKSDLTPSGAQYTPVHRFQLLG
jgi:2'-5' RNA ligase